MSTTGVPRPRRSRASASSPTLGAKIATTARLASRTGAMGITSRGLPRSVLALLVRLTGRRVGRSVLVVLLVDLLGGRRDVQLGAGDEMIRIENDVLVRLEDVGERLLVPVHLLGDRHQGVAGLDDVLPSVPFPR